MENVEILKLLKVLYFAFGGWGVLFLFAPQTGESEHQ